MDVHKRSHRGALRHGTSDCLGIGLLLSDLRALTLFLPLPNLEASICRQFLSMLHPRTTLVMVSWLILLRFTILFALEYMQRLHG